MSRPPACDQRMTVPCGQCVGCRLERSRQWAVRCVHEAQMHDDNCFVTLTYDDDYLPYGETLHRPDFQKFMKRLIKNSRRKIRLFYCGEYGDDTLRPHYHACLFGYRPDDPELFSTKGDYKLYTSKFLSKTWGLGHASFGELTFETAAYTARYCVKKITGKNAKVHYETMDPETGEITERVPEFSGSSRRPGIGATWLKKYGADTYLKNEVILRGMAMKPPRFYDDSFAKIDAAIVEIAKLERRNKYHEKMEALPRDYAHSRRLYAAKIIAEKRLTTRDHIL